VAAAALINLAGAILIALLKDEGGPLIYALRREYINRFMVL